MFDAAKEQYAMAHGLANGAEVDPHVLEPYLKGKWENEKCPSAMHNTYTIGRIGEQPECSIHGQRLDTHLPSGKKPK